MKLSGFDAAIEAVMRYYHTGDDVSWQYIESDLAEMRKTFQMELNNGES